MSPMLAVLVLLTAAPPPTAIDFKLQYLTVQGRRQHTVYEDFDGDGKPDILNASIDFDQDPPERWFALHLNRAGGFSPSADHQWSVSGRAGAAVYGDFLPGGGVEVGFIAEDGVFLHPWKDGRPAAAPVKILHDRTFFRSPSLEQLPRWQMRLDLDADKRDDLLVPLADGYRIYFQTAPGVFGRTSTLEADLRPGRPRTLGASAFAQALEVVSAQFLSTVQLPRVEVEDVNGDGLKDLLVVRGDTITYFKQKSPGVFPSRRPYKTTYAIPTLRERARKDTVDVSMLKFADLNQDKLPDLIVTRVEGTVGLWESIKTSIYIHLGTGRGNFVADKRIVIDGLSIEPDFIDMNGNGKLDAVTSRLRTDLIRQAVTAVILGDITISYEVFRFEADKNMFQSDPVYEKRIFVRRKDLKTVGAEAVALVAIKGDLSGDGRPDLVKVDPAPKTQGLYIYPGRGKGATIDFDSTAHWKVPVTRHPKGLAVRDVNGDGLNDIVLHHGGTLGLVIARRR